MKRVVLSMAIMALLCGGQAWAQSAVPGAPPAQNVASPAVPATNVLQPTAAPNASVGALQQALSQQQAGTPSVPSSAPTAAPTGLPSSFESADESTLLREMGRQQARLSFLKMMAQIEKEKVGIERERLKFEQEKQEMLTGGKSGGGAGPLPSGGAMGLPALPSTAPLATPSASGAVQDMMEQAPERPTVRSIYSVGGQYFAEIIVSGVKTIASAGKTLSDGTRVISMGSGGVVINQRGKRVTLGVQAVAAPAAKAGP